MKYKAKVSSEIRTKHANNGEFLNSKPGGT